MAGQLFSLLSLLWLLLSLAFGDQFAEIRNRFSDKPVLTQRQELNNKHRQTIGFIKSVIESSHSSNEAQVRLKQTEWPSKVLVIFTQAETGSYTEIYSREVWTGVSSLSKSGIGYGAMVLAKGRQDYVVLEETAKTGNRETVAFSLYVEAERAD